jgi:hypothetical protein
MSYNEMNPDESDALSGFRHESLQPVDAIIIVGTRLKIGDLKKVHFQPGN